MTNSAPNVAVPPHALRKAHFVITGEAEPVTPRGHLQRLLDRAQIVARVEPADDLPGLRVVLLSGSRLPFTHFAHADEATTWLTEAGIQATAGTDEDGNVVLHLPTDTVDAVGELLASAYIRAEAAAGTLQHALLQAGIGLAEVTVAEKDAVVVEIADCDNLATGVELGVLLGADHLAQGLPLHRPKGMRKLGQRLGLVLTGAVGRGVDVLAAPGCEHRDDRLVISLDVEQAVRLAERLTAAAPSASATDGAGDQR